MRKTLLIAVVLAVGAALGATVLREPLAAAANPFQHVIVGNDTSQAIPVREQNLDNGNIRVHEEGVAQVAGTFSISNTGNTVNLGTADHSDLDSANTHLANIDSQTAKLSFDSSGHLETTSSQTLSTGSCWDRFDVAAGHTEQFNCNGVTNASAVIVGGADDSATVLLLDNGQHMMALFGGGNDGNDQWQVPLGQPLPVNAFSVTCDNFVEDCKLFVEVTGSIGS